MALFLSVSFQMTLPGRVREDSAVSFRIQSFTLDPEFFSRCLSILRPVREVYSSPDSN